MILAVCAPKPRIFIRNSAAEKTSFFSAFLHSQKQLLILMTEGFLRSYRQWNEIFLQGMWSLYQMGFLVLLVLA